MGWYEDEDYEIVKPYGTITLERWRGDRGHYRLTFSITPPVSKILKFVSNMYYFDLDNAKLEIDAWLRLGESDINLDDITRDLAYFTDAKLLTGKLCIVSVSNIRHPSNLIIVDLGVPLGVEKYLHVDGDDRFPRFYINKEIALNEAVAWMKVRNQLISEDFVDLDDVMESKPI